MCVLGLLAAVVVHGWVARVVGVAPALGIGCWADFGVCGECCGCPQPLLWRDVLFWSAALCVVLCCSCTRVLLWAPMLALCAWALRCLVLFRCLMRRVVLLCASIGSVCPGGSLSCAAFVCVVLRCSIVRLYLLRHAALRCVLYRINKEWQLTAIRARPRTSSEAKSR